MFSQRLPENLEPNEYSKLLAAKRAAGVRLLDLTESNPTKAGIPYPKEEILAALADARSLVYEPTPRGLLPAREAVARYYADRGQRVHPDQILLTASTSEAYSYLFKLFADPGESFLVPTPSYPLFDLLAGLEAISLVPYPLQYGADRGWRIDFESFRRALVPSAKGVLLVNPNNPTGSCLRKAELAEIRQFVAERGLALVCDEVFSDYVTSDDPDIVSSLAGTEEGLSFTLNGLSKACGLPQLKLGWIIVNGPAQQRIEVMRRLEMIADTYLSVGAPVQHAAATLLALRGPIQAAIHERIKTNRARLANLRPTACHDLALRSDGGWYAVCPIGDWSDEKLVLEWLLPANLLVHPGYFFGFGDLECIVLSLLPPPEEFALALRTIDHIAGLP